MQFFCINFLLLLCLTAKADVIATTDRLTLSINESLNLEIIQTGDSSGKPDLRLLDKDFSVLSQSQSQQYTIVNGKSSNKHVWSIGLLPKKSGKLVIPAIKVGSETTLPIHLSIQKNTQKKSSKGKVNSNQDVFIQVSASPENKVYVQQKIDLVIRIYYRIQLSNLALGSININDVIMEQVGEDKQYNKIINQQTYMVIERHYALFPQKSGFLTIPSIRFEAMQGSTGSNFGFFSQRGKPVYRQSDAISIEIMKKPDSYTAKYWLPTETLDVISKHSDLSNIKVGDSITLTDKIVARGVLGSLLPSIGWPKTKHLKSYPDQSKNNSQNDKGSIYGLREEKMAIIPMRAGKFQLPDRKIYWWNTLTNQQQEKIIPGISFDVSEAESSLSLSDQNAKKQHAIATPVYNTIDENLTSNNITNGNKEHPASIIKNYTGYPSLKDNPWFWAWLITTLILSLLLVISLFFIKRKSPSTNHIEENKEKKQQSHHVILKQIKHSCANNDKSTTINLFIQWANSYFDQQQFSSLNELSQQISDPKLKQQINNLEQALYAKKSIKWQGDKLFEALQSYVKQHKKEHKLKPIDAKIQPLNPL